MPRTFPDEFFKYCLAVNADDFVKSKLIDYFFFILSRPGTAII